MGHTQLLIGIILGFAICCIYIIITRPRFSDIDMDLESEDVKTPNQYTRPFIEVKVSDMADQYGLTGNARKSFIKRMERFKIRNPFYK